MSVASCSVCGGQSSEIVSYRVLQKIDARLMRCGGCGFIFVHEPTWLESSFLDELNDLDIGSVDRCVVVLDFLEVLARSERLASATILDWGGGYGLLTRMARDRGLDCVNFDPYVKDLFSGPARVHTEVSAGIAVASEVFLHLPDPLSALNNLLAHSDTVLVTAVVPPEDMSADWWYLMPETGQHVAFFPVSALEELARRSGTRLHTDGRFFHVFTRRTLRLRTRVVVRSRVVAYGLALSGHIRRQIRRSVGRNPSLTPADQRELMQRRGRQDA